MTDERRAYQALAALGFRANEVRVLAGQLAEACARTDFDMACDVAEKLQPYAAQLPELYRALLVAGVPKSAGRLHVVDGYGRMNTSMS
jgi:hypothetical protein